MDVLSFFACLSVIYLSVLGIKVLRIRQTKKRIDREVKETIEKVSRWMKRHLDKKLEDVPLNLFHDGIDHIIFNIDGSMERDPASIIFSRQYHETVRSFNGGGNRDVVIKLDETIRTNLEKYSDD